MISDETCVYVCMISDEVDGGGAGLLPGGGDEPPLCQGSVQTRQGPGETRQQEGVSGGWDFICDRACTLRRHPAIVVLLTKKIPWCILLYKYIWADTPTRDVPDQRDTWWYNRLFFVCSLLVHPDVTAVCILESFQNQQSMLLADKVLKSLGKEKAKDKYKVGSNASQSQRGTSANHMEGEGCYPIT